MKKRHTVMEFCDQSRNFTNFTPDFIFFIHILLTLRKLASVQKVYIFQPFLQKVLNAKIDQKDSHGRFRNVKEKS